MVYIVTCTIQVYKFLFSFRFCKLIDCVLCVFFFSSRRRHTRSVSAFLLNRSSDLGSVDPNFGRRVRNRRQLNSLQNTWPYGYSMPIAVRYTQDAFSRSGWLWPVDAKGEPLKATSYMAVGFYVAKYVNKKSDM